MKKLIVVFMILAIATTVQAWQKVDNKKVSRNVVEVVDTVDLLNQKKRAVRKRNRYQKVINGIDKQLQDIANNTDIKIVGYSKVKPLKPIKVVKPTKPAVNWEDVSKVSSVGVNWNDVQTSTVYSTRPYDERMNDKMWERSMAEYKLGLKDKELDYRKDTTIESAKLYSSVEDVKVIVHN